MADSDDRGPAFRIYIATMLSVAIVAVALRFWSRSLNRNVGGRTYRFWWDDWVALAATVVLIGQQAVILEWVHLGFGRHIWTLPPQNLALFSKLVFVSYFFYDTALFLTKASALLFLSRIFPPFANSRFFNLALYVTHGLNIAWLLGIIFGTIFFCDPVQKNWDTSIEGTCGTNTDLFIGSAVPSVAIDLIILILPLPKVWRLQTSTSKRWAITAVFVLGYGVIILSIGRLVTVLTSGSALDNDLTYGAVPIFYWAGAESPVTILCICLPAMLPLAKHLGNEYFEPLVNKVSSILSSRASRGSSFKSRSGLFSQQSSANGIELLGTSKGVRPEGHIGVSIARRDSISQMPNLTATADNYAAYIESHGNAGTGNLILPQHSIRVENDVLVSRDEL
ncbi:hypothetical protein F4780DRAFT_733979 [Xylariomycetidae sp. FL0641]|nr:hypothetical protein F4780DRAFT_733979 [Xylariomycetidae sp. FL0641]